MDTKKFSKVLSMICLIGWGFLCISAATGLIEVDVIDYCLVTGLLALHNLVELI